MRRVALGPLLLLLVLPAVWALDDSKDKPKDEKSATPSQQYDALKKEFDAGRQKIITDYQAAKTPEEKQKQVTAFYAKPKEYAGRFLELAKKNPKDPAALKALTWITQFGPDSPEYKQALDLLARNYADSPDIKPICQGMAQSGNADAAKFLRTVTEKNPDRDTKAFATLGLAQSLRASAEAAAAKKSPDADKISKEAEKVYEQVAKEYANVTFFSGTLGKVAEDELFDLRHLAVGKKAPEIEGEDLDGKKFKLSDYKGKVVLLDFWGHW